MEDLELIFQKAEYLMPYIHSNYGNISSSEKLILALDAAYNLVYSKGPGGGGSKQVVGSEFIFDKINVQAWQNWINSLVAQKLVKVKNLEDSLKLAKKLASGDYFGQNGPKFEAPMSLYGRLPKRGSHDKLKPYFDNFTEKSTVFLKSVKATVSEAEIPVKKEVKFKIEKPLNNIPLEKQRLIDQLANQLNSSSNLDDNGKSTLIEQLHRVTPHLSDEQRKQMIPENMHGLHDAIIMKIQKVELPEEDEIEDEEATEQIPNLVQNLLKVINPEEKHSDLHEMTADLSQDDFELSVEALLDLGYSEESIMAEAERRFSR